MVLSLIARALLSLLLSLSGTGTCHRPRPHLILISLCCEAGVTCEPSSHARCRGLGRARPFYIMEGMGMEMETGMAMGTALSLDSNCGFGFRGGGSKIGCRAWCRPCRPWRGILPKLSDKSF